MKYLKYLLIVGVAFVSLSSHMSRTSRLSEGIYPGNLLPDIENLENKSGAKIKLSDLKGQKVLVNFWAAYDADSRKNNALFSNMIEKRDYPVQMVSISFDKSKSVFERTLALDKIDGKYQFMVNDGDFLKVFDLYRLESGFKNYLIDENGVIIGMNLSPEELDQALT